MLEMRKGQKRTRQTMDVACSDSEFERVERPGRREAHCQTPDTKGSQAERRRPSYLCFLSQDDQEASGERLGDSDGRERERWSKSKTLSAPGSERASVPARHPNRLCSPRDHRALPVPRLCFSH
jgi:hypothetical protein